MIPRNLMNQYNTNPPQVLSGGLTQRNTSSYQTTNDSVSTLRLPSINAGSKSKSPLKRQGSMGQFGGDDSPTGRLQVLERIIFNQAEKMDRVLNSLDPEQTR